MLLIDELIRTRRRSIALVVQADGRLVVRAPLRAAQAEIQRALEKHAAWIVKKQAQARQLQTACPPPTYTAGEEFWFLGVPRRLELCDRRRPMLALEDSVFRLSRAAGPRSAATFQAWYRLQAARLLPERVSGLAARFGFRPRGVRITSARTRWGSCSPGGMLAFSWRLMIAPWPVIEYVILHELVHLETKNHSAAFWEQLGALVPDYKDHIHWLKTHGPHASNL